eukprot:Platyproteum_vivax@DN4807_c0_g1_i1.p1
MTSLVERLDQLSDELLCYDAVSLLQQVEQDEKELEAILEESETESRLQIESLKKQLDLTQKSVEYAKTHKKDMDLEYLIKEIESTSQTLEIKERETQQVEEPVRLPQTPKPDPLLRVLPILKKKVDALKMMTMFEFHPKSRNCSQECPLGDLSGHVKSRGPHLKDLVQKFTDKKSSESDCQIDSCSVDFSDYMWRHVEEHLSQLIKEKQKENTQEVQ